MIFVLLLLDNIEKVLEEFFVEREGADITERLATIDFIDEGILDSLDFLSLAIFVEEKFNLKLDMASTETFSAMRTMDGIVQLISDRSKG